MVVVVRGVLNPVLLLPLKVRIGADLLPFGGFPMIYGSNAELYVYCYCYKGIGLGKTCMSKSNLFDFLEELMQKRRGPRRLLSLS